MELGTPGVTVSWKIPTAVDLSGPVDTRSTILPGNVFAIGETIVEYTFEDQFQNRAMCNFTVAVEPGAPQSVFVRIFKEHH